MRAHALSERESRRTTDKAPMRALFQLGFALWCSALFTNSFSLSHFTLFRSLSLSVSLLFCLCCTCEQWRLQSWSCFGSSTFSTLSLALRVVRIALAQSIVACDKDNNNNTNNNKNSGENNRSSSGNSIGFFSAQTNSSADKKVPVKKYKKVEKPKTCSLHASNGVAPTAKV